jgi:hypothetical protein
MAIVGPLFALVGRLAGRLLNSALGWATILLFGKVEGRKQTVMLLIALGSLVWVLVLVGVVLPDVGTFLLAFVPKPDFIPDWVVQMVMLGLAATIPLLVGAAAVFVTEPRSRPRGGGLISAILRGYPFTLVLALTIAVLSLVSLFRKVRSLSKRWEDAHVPVVIKPGGYDEVIDDLREVLTGAGIQVRPRPAPAVLSIPPRLLDAVAGKALGGLVPDRLILLQAGDLEVLVYPSDVAISGTRVAMARSRAAIAAKLTTSPVYLTTSAESERVEDAIKSLADDPAADAERDLDRLRDLDARIATLAVPFDDWETVYRERLQLERTMLERIVRRRTGSVPGGTSPPPRSRAGAGRLEEPLPARLLGWVGIGLIVADVMLLLAERLSPPRRSRSSSRHRVLMGVTGLGRMARWWR